MHTSLGCGSNGCIYWLQLQSLLGSAAASSSASYSSGSRPRTPTAAEEYARCRQSLWCSPEQLLAATPSSMSSNDVLTTAELLYLHII